MAAPKRNGTERERDLDKIAALAIRNVPHARIAEQIGVTRQQIDYDLKTIRERWRKSAERTAGDELAKLDAIEAEHWTGWEASQDPAHLVGARACVKERIALLGLAAPLKAETTVKVQPILGFKVVPPALPESSDDAGD